MIYAICVCARVCSHMCVCIHICIYMYTYICMYVCMYVWMDVCIYVCMHVCMYVHTVYTVYTCAFITTVRDRERESGGEALALISNPWLMRWFGPDMLLACPVAVQPSPCQYPKMSFFFRLVQQQRGQTWLIHPFQSITVKRSTVNNGVHQTGVLFFSLYKTLWVYLDRSKPYVLDQKHSKTICQHFGVH